MIRLVLPAVLLAALLPDHALAQGVPAPCAGIPSAARSPGPISIPTIALDLPGTITAFPAATLRALEARFDQRDALVSVPSPPVYTGAGAEQVAMMVHTRILERGAYRSAFAEGPAALEGERWAGLYSDGTLDMLVLAEPATDWPPRGVPLSPADITLVSQFSVQDGVFVTTYAGKGVVQAVCEGRASAVVRFIASVPKPAQMAGPGGCAMVVATAADRDRQASGVPQSDLNLAGMATKWPRPVELALLAPVRAKAGPVVLGAFAGYEAAPVEVARRYAGRLTELPGWRAVYPGGIRPMPGGRQAGLFSNGAADVLLLAYPGADFTGDTLLATADSRSAMRAFLLKQGQPFGTVTIRYEGRGLADAVCGGQLGTLLPPE